MVGDNDNVDPLAGYSAKEKRLLLAELMKFFGLKTPEAALRRALAVARAAKRYSDKEAS